MQQLTSVASQVGGHLDGDVELLELDLGETVDTGDVVGDLERDLASGALGVAGDVQIASVRTGTVGVDLVDGDLNLATGLDLGDLARGQSVLGDLADIDIAGKLSTSALVHDVGFNLGITDNGRVHLAGVDVRAVAGNAGVNCEPCQYGQSLGTQKKPLLFLLHFRPQLTLEAETGRRTRISLGIKDNTVAPGHRHEG